MSGLGRESSADMVKELARVRRGKKVEECPAFTQFSPNWLDMRSAVGVLALDWGGSESENELHPRVTKPHTPPSSTLASGVQSFFMGKGNQARKEEGCWLQYKGRVKKRWRRAHRWQLPVALSLASKDELNN